MSVGQRDETRRRFLDVSRKQKQFVSKRRRLGAKLAQSCSAENSLKSGLTDKSEDGLPIRTVLRQSPRRPMAENIERNLLMYQSTVE